MDYYTERRLINLNSEDADQFLNETSTFLSNVVFNFSNVLKEERDILFVEGGLYNAQIPISFYTVNYTNNILYYKIDSTTKFITIPIGNYNFTTFSTACIAQFLLNGDIFTITINQTTGILTFTFIPSGNTLTSFIENNSTSWSILGFVKNSGDFLATSNIITPPFLLNLLGVKKLKLYSEAFSILSLDSTENATTNLIDTIPNYSQSYGLLTHSNNDGIYGKLKKKLINQIDIQIKDEFSNYINFNNTNWSITLALIIYRKVKKNETDMSDLLNKLGNIETIMANITTPQENVNSEENINPQENPINLDVGDLDLLLYENTF
jgi:hypothetical protein